MFNKFTAVEDESRKLQLLAMQLEEIRESGSAEDYLVCFADFERTLKRAQRAAARLARQDGMFWADIGRFSGMSAQGAQQRWGRR